MIERSQLGPAIDVCDSSPYEQSASLVSMVH